MIRYQFKVKMYENLLGEAEYILYEEKIDNTNQHIG